ncbi:MAG: heavy metal translocating P-type ATPase [Pseudomonadota bacterium]
MTNAADINTDALGCPSGLEPAARQSETGEALIDPAPFVRVDGPVAKLDLAVFGAKCAGCISKIESAMNSFSGMKQARLNLSTGRLSLAWTPGALEPRAIAEQLHSLGYRAAPFDPAQVEAAHDEDGRRLLRALAVAGFAMANIMLLSVSVWAGGAEMGEGARGLMHWASALIAIPAALYAGRPFFSSAWAALKVRKANMDVPISLAVFLALSISIYEFFAGGEHAYFDAAVMLLFFLLIGRYLDHRLRWRARAAARDLLALQSATARRFRADGGVETVAARDIAPGDQLLLSPGDAAPVDGVIVDGSAYCDVSLVTGESAPKELSDGDKVYSGVVNQSSRLVIEATATSDTSLIAELTRLIEKGEQSRSRYVRLADRAASLYVPVVHSLALATFCLWFFFLDGGVRLSLLNAVAVLIITCPCALGLAAPAVQVVATGRLFKEGVLVKSGDALERLAEADVFVFDKTGTLTLGKPVLVNADALPDGAVRDAASLARVSRHPLSRALVDHVGAGEASASAVETPGLGVEGFDGETRMRFGSAAWVGADGGDDDRMEAWFWREGSAPIRFSFDDRPREDAAQIIEALRGRGFAIELLSGDRESAVQSLAQTVGIDAWRSGLTPQEKIERLKALQGEGARVAMIGDGLNDAPSLAAAHVSLSPGGAAEISQAASDFVYLGDRLEPIATSIDVSRQARRRVLENFAFAAFYNACAVPLAVAGFVTPLIAALAMSGSSMVVTLNALRLSRRAAKSAK